MHIGPTKMLMWQLLFSPVVGEGGYHIPPSIAGQHVGSSLLRLPFRQRKEWRTPMLGYGL
jgi:hypothetical protein